MPHAKGANDELQTALKAKPFKVPSQALRGAKKLVVYHCSFSFSQQVHTFRYELGARSVGVLLLTLLLLLLSQTWLHKASADPRLRGLDISSFLIMPVQRLPRYILL